MGFGGVTIPGSAYGSVAASCKIFSFIKEEFLNKVIDHCLLKKGFIGD
jgi:hypothetical protein